MIFHLGMSGRWRVDPSDARQARPSGDRDRRGRTCRAQRSAAVRVGRSVADRGARRLPRRSPRSARNRSGPTLTAGLSAQRMLAGRIASIKHAAARSAHRRRAWQHLCLRGAVPGPDQPGTRRGPGHSRGARTAGPGDPRGSGGSIAAGGSTIARLCPPDGELGYFCKQFAGLWPRGRGLPLRRHDHTAGAGWAQQFLVCEMPEIVPVPRLTPSLTIRATEAKGRAFRGLGRALLGIGCVIDRIISCQGPLSIGSPRSRTKEPHGQYAASPQAHPSQ